MSQQILRKLPGYLSSLDKLVIRFVSWWAGELLALLPGIKGWQANAVLLQLKADQSVAFYGKLNKKDGEREEVVLPSLSAAHATTLENLCKRKTLWVSIPTADVLFLQYQFPVSVGADFKQAVAYKLITESPIQQELIFFDAQVDKAQSSTSTLLVNVALTRKEVVARIAKQLERCGVSASKIGYAAAAAGHLDYTFDMSEADKHAEQNKRWQIYLAMLWLLMMLAFFPISTLLAKRLANNLHEQAVELLKPDVQHLAVERRESEVNALYQQLNAVTPTVSVTNLIDATASGLPADAWVNQLEYVNNKLTLVGQAPQALSIVQDLKQQALLANAKLGNISNANGLAQFEVSVNLAKDVE